MLNITNISIYPVKSLRGVELDHAAVQNRGLEGDRRWMLIDNNNRFISQRECPKMSTIRAVQVKDGLSLEFPDQTKIKVLFPDDSNDIEKVTIWNSTVEAALADENYNSFISNYLGTPCRLVYMPDWALRRVNPRFDSGNDIVSFADGYPFLIIGRTSLEELNKRLTEPVPMERFRPNLVFSGGEPFCEDNWSRIRIGEVVFRVVKPCERCVITTIDQNSGKPSGPEPLRTLATFRRSAGGTVLFGQNMIAENPGPVIKIGDEVEILEYRDRD